MGGGVSKPVNRTWTNARYLHGCKNIPDLIQELQHLYKKSDDRGEALWKCQRMMYVFMSAIKGAGAEKSEVVADLAVKAYMRVFILQADADEERKLDTPDQFRLVEFLTALSGSANGLPLCQFTQKHKQTRRQKPRTVFCKKLAETLDKLKREIKCKNTSVGAQEAQEARTAELRYNEERRVIKVDADDGKEAERWNNLSREQKKEEIMRGLPQCHTFKDGCGVYFLAKTGHDHGFKPCFALIHACIECKNAPAVRNTEQKCIDCYLKDKCFCNTASLKFAFVGRNERGDLDDIRNLNLTEQQRDINIKNGVHELLQPNYFDCIEKITRGCCRDKDGTPRVEHKHPILE
jgi:hypothetical protein